MTALFRFIARLGKGLLRIYVARNISRRWSRCSFVFLSSRRFFGQETFIKGYRGVTVKRKRVLTIGQSSEVISNNPVQRPLCRGRLFTENSSGALKSSIGFTIDGFVFSWNVRAPVTMFSSQYRQGINRSLILNVPVVAVARIYRLVWLLALFPCFNRTWMRAVRQLKTPAYCGGLTRRQVLENGIPQRCTCLRERTGWDKLSAKIPHPLDACK